MNNNDNNTNNNNTTTDDNNTTNTTNSKNAFHRTTAYRMQRAAEIAARYDERGGVFPRYLNARKISDPARKQEYRDADKVK